MLSILKQFLVEQEQCTKGFVWCPVKKKCIPEGEQKSKGKGKGKGFGKGKGPVGVPKKGFGPGNRPRNERREIVKEPPVEIEKDIELKKIKELLTTMLDEVYNENENTLDPAPKDEPEEELDSLKKDIAESLRFFNESKYQEFFQSMLKKFGVTGVGQLKGEKKKEFFDTIEKEWTTEKKVNEMDRILDEHAYGDFFLGMLKKFGVTGVMKMDVEKRKEFFNAIKKGWASQKASGQ